MYLVLYNALCITQVWWCLLNREMLCSLVRRAFKQTEEQQLQFEQILKHDYGRRSKGEVDTHTCTPFEFHKHCSIYSAQILAKELAGQLQVLENNAHPFYKPKLFVVSINIIKVNRNFTCRCTYTCM